MSHAKNTNRSILRNTVSEGHNESGSWYLHQCPGEKQQEPHRSSEGRWPGSGRTPYMSTRNLVQSRYGWPNSPRAALATPIKSPHCGNAPVSEKSIREHKKSTSGPGLKFSLLKKLQQTLLTYWFIRHKVQSSCPQYKGYLTWPRSVDHCHSRVAGPVSAYKKGSDFRT
jgi:hypothetical protein